MIQIEDPAKYNNFPKRIFTDKSTAAMSKTRIPIHMVTQSIRIVKDKAPGVGRLVQIITAIKRAAMPTINSNTEAAVKLKSIFSWADLLKVYFVADCVYYSKSCQVLLLLFYFVWGLFSGDD